MNDRRLLFLIKKLKQGKKEYFDEFYALTKGRVYYKVKSCGITDGALVEDVMQETYLSFLKNLSKTDESRNPLAYLLTIAGNKGIDELRRRKRTDGNVCADELTLKAEHTYTHDTPLLELCYKKLSREELKLLETVFIYGYKRIEAAELLKLPVSTVYRRYDELIKKLKILREEAYA